MSDALSRATSLVGLPAIPDDAAFKPPTFSHDFTSEMFPDFDGPIVLRYPTFGDEVEIERRSLLRGSGFMGRCLAYVEVCLKTAPAPWWRPAPGSDKDASLLPLPAPDRILDSVALMGMVTKFLKWRDSFRNGVSPETGPTPQ